MAITLNWGILGAGGIAKSFARGVAGSETGTVVAVGSRDQAKADAFGIAMGVERRHGSYEALLADDEVQAIYVATPHPQHAEWAIKCAAAGKHVLCEKPLAVNAWQAAAIVDACERHGVRLMEAFMYRCHPQARRVYELVRSGAIGSVRLIQATFSFNSPRNPESRLYNDDLAGGGILDVGCYPVSYARLIAGAATGKPFADPLDVQGVAHLGPTGVDEWAAATLRFASTEEGRSPAIVAQVACGIGVNAVNTLTVYGSEGRIEVAEPWVPAREGGTTHLMLHRPRGQPETIAVTSELPIYGLEADAFATLVETGEPPHPAMSTADSLGNMRALDAWRRSVGLTYRQETADGYPRATVSGDELRVADDHNMRYGRIKNLGRPVSRLIMGVDNQHSLPHAAVMFDDYFARGGNTFDTAFIYGGGSCERALADWMRVRGVREQVNVIVKGAHTPFCDPASLTRQLKESLDRLGTDVADIYMMHRDNPDVPVGEFVDVLNEHARAGRVKAFGGSNWPVARVQAANEYAKAKGLQPFVVVSDNLSLARMVDPVWRGCVTVHDAASRRWLAENDVALLSWSSQARGFFLPGRASPEQRDDKELVRCWYSDDNFKRLARAKELAEKKGVETINIAAAWVLAQPFEVFALIGPRALAETRSTMAALDVELTPDEVRWLNLEA